MRYTYTSIAALKMDKREGHDFAVIEENRGSEVVVMAPHGGRIEPFTTELAGFIAGEDLSFYSFVGLQPEDNLRDLHIVSHLFDEERALALAAGAETVLAVHGERTCDESFVMTGGLNEGLVAALEIGLRKTGFETRKPPAELAGRHSGNICNRGRLGAGVQIEVSCGLIDELRAVEDRRAAFVSTVRGVLLGAPDGSAV